MTAEIKVLEFYEGLDVDPPGENPPVNVVNQKFRTVEQIDSVTTGANAVSEDNTSSIMKFTASGLLSLANIPGADKNQLLIIINNTGADSEIINGSGILTGTGENLGWANGSALFLAFIESLDDWLVVGGSGGGGGSAQKKYTIANNQSLTDVAGLLLDATKYTSYFIRMEIERIGTVTYRQILEAKAVYDGANWAIFFGSYAGSDIVQSSLTNAYEITLAITGVGQLRYSSGNQAGHTKSSLKVILEGLKT